MVCFIAGFTTLQFFLISIHLFVIAMGKGSKN